MREVLGGIDCLRRCNSGRSCFARGCLTAPLGRLQTAGVWSLSYAWSNFSLRVTKPFEPRKQMLRICSSHSRSTNKKTALRRLFLFVERETGFEPATLSLEGDSSPFS